MSKFNLTNIGHTILPSPSNIISTVVSNLPSALQTPILSFTASSTESALPSFSNIAHIIPSSSSLPASGNIISAIISSLPSPSTTASFTISNLPSPSALPSLSVLSSANALPSASEALHVFTDNSTTITSSSALVANLPSLVQSILPSPSSVASVVVSNLPSLTMSALPNASNIADIMPSPSFLPSIAISALPSLSSLPDVISNSTITVPSVGSTNLPDFELPKQNWIGDDVFKGWLMVTTGGILILGCVGIVLGIVTLICLCKNNKHDYHQHPPYSISVVNSPPSEKIESGNKVVELRDILTKNSIGNSQLVGDPTYDDVVNSGAAVDFNESL